MKNQYSILLFIVCLLTGRLAVGQDTGPRGPVGNGGRADNRPFVGVGISIPLHKLIGPRKAKVVLPVHYEGRSMELPDSVVAANSRQGVVVVAAKQDSAAPPMPQMAAKPDSGGVVGQGSGDGSGATTHLDEPCDDPDSDCPDSDIDHGQIFGVVGGSGSDSNPYLLSEVVVIAQGSGNTTDYGSGSYYYSGGTWGGTYYNSGYYQDTQYGGGGNGGGPKPLPKVFNGATKSSKEEACNTFRSMWNRQNNDRHVEQLAFITDKGIFWLSDAQNTVKSAELGGVDEYNGTVGQKYFIKDGVTYYIKAIVHTHPLGGAGQWKDGLSTADLDRAKEFGVPMYVIADEGISKGRANGTNQGIIDHNFSTAFDCQLDQNVFEELR